MSSSVTHSYFSIDVYDKVNKNVREGLKHNTRELKVFAQGPDPYFFYDFHLTKRSKRIYEINYSMHHKKVNDHFLSLINYINDKDYYSNCQVMAYLYGQVCHYALDTITHPFTIYNTGIYDNKNRNTYKYNGLHEDMEYYIDTHLIYTREKIFPKDYKVYDNIFNIEKFSNELKDVIDNVTKNVYGFDNVSDIYYKSIMDMKKFYLIFNYDKYGIKKFIYKIMDLVCGNKFVKKSELSFHVSPNSKEYYLNNEKNVWNHPCDIMEKYDFSFDELYIKAVNYAVSIINEIDNMLKNKNIDCDKVKNLFGNLDYATGKDCSLNLECKYFKF